MVCVRLPLGALTEATLPSQPTLCVCTPVADAHPSRAAFFVEAPGNTKIFFKTKQFIYECLVGLPVETEDTFRNLQEFYSAKGLC